MKKSAFLLMLLFSSFALVSLGEIKMARASGTVYIRSDGSVDPQASPILRDGYRYTLTDDIFDSIVVERDNILIMGAGHTVQGVSSIYNINYESRGIDLSARENVTLRDLTIRNFGYGVRLDYGFENRIVENNITSNRIGVWLYYSSNNSISNNNLVGNFDDVIQLYHSSNNTMTQNFMDEAKVGMVGEQIDFKLLGSSNYNNISKNTMTGGGIYLESSHGSHISANTLHGNSIRVEGSTLSDFVHTIDSSNTENGKPIYYLVNQKGVTISPATYPNIAYLAVVNSTNVTVENLDFTYVFDREDAVLLAYTNNSLIRNDNLAHDTRALRFVGCRNNTVVQNSFGQNDESIWLESSSGNTFRENHINAEDGRYCVYLVKSSGNLFFNNDFTAVFRKYSSNAKPAGDIGVTQPTIPLSVNSWDNGSRGNYWSGYYNGTDSNRDGIGDTPFVIYANNEDHFPLMQSYVVTGPPEPGPPETGPAQEDVLLIPIAVAAAASLAVIATLLFVHFRRRRR